MTWHGISGMDLTGLHVIGIHALKLLWLSWICISSTDLLTLCPSHSWGVRCCLCTCRRKWSSLAETCLTLCKCMEHKLWPDAHPLRQFEHTLSPEVSKEIGWTFVAVTTQLFSLQYYSYFILVRNNAQRYWNEHLAATLRLRVTHIGRERHREREREREREWEREREK